MAFTCMPQFEMNAIYINIIYQFTSYISYKALRMTTRLLAIEIFIFFSHYVGIEV